MAQKFHISEDGIARVCNAKGPCPLGGSELHFDTKEEAQAYADKKAEEEYGIRGEFSSEEEYLQYMRREPIEEFYDLFDKLVPISGKADTVAGEMVRAFGRIHYRYYNDGDKINEGYGEETVDGSARYLISVYNSDPESEHLSENIEKMFMNINKDDDIYEMELEDLAANLVDYLKENPKLEETKNTIDSRKETFEG